MKIALMGFARSGKDTVAEMIWMFADRYVSRIAFGSDLKRDFHSMFMDIPAEPKPREGYEKFGKAMRSIDPDIWVKKLAFNVKVIEEYDIAHDFVITDLRQPNEHRWAKENGYIIVKVTAPTEVREERSTGDTEFNSINDSELAIPYLDYDFQIHNNGTLDDLRQQVISLLEDIKEEN